MQAVDSTIGRNGAHASTLNGEISAREPRPLRWTIGEYEKLTATGIFDGRRVELIEGEIVEMAAMLRPHALVLTKAGDRIRAYFGAGYFLNVQAPMPIPPGSMPEPDIAVFAGRPDDFPDQHPSNALLIIEVSDSTLENDRTTKASLYARGGIADYWILNIPDKRLEVRRSPIEDAMAVHGWSYSETKVLLPGDAVTPLAAPDGSTSIAVSDLLP